MDDLINFIDQYSVQAAADKMGVSPRTVEGYLSKGKIPESRLALLKDAPEMITIKDMIERLKYRFNYTDGLAANMLGVTVNQIKEGEIPPEKHDFLRALILESLTVEKFINDNGYTVEEFAEEMNVHERTVRRWIKGRRIQNQHVFKLKELYQNAKP